MATILRIGILLVLFTFITNLIDNTEADDAKKKRVIIKVPARIKHIYHHHTKKIHIRKKKPKTKPASVHVVHVEEEVHVKPIKSWNSIEAKLKGSGGRGRSKKSQKSTWHEGQDWTPKGFTLPEEIHGNYEEYGGEASGTEEDYYTWGGDEDYKSGSGKSLGKWNHDDFSREGSKKGKRGTMRGNNRGKLRGIGESAYDYEEPLHDGSYKREEKRKPNWKRPSRGSGGTNPKRNRPQSNRPRYEDSNNFKRGNRKPKKENMYIGPEDYDDTQDNEYVWPERKEHPSWHQRRQNKQWSPPANVREEVDDDPLQYDYGCLSNDHFNPSPSDKQNQWLPPPPPPSQPPTPIYTVRPHLPAVFQPQRPPAGSGYHNQVAHSADGKSVGYQSHVGHSSDANRPSSSFQSVKFGNNAAFRR